MGGQPLITESGELLDHARLSIDTEFLSKLNNLRQLLREECSANQIFGAGIVCNRRHSRASAKCDSSNATRHLVNWTSATR